MSFDNSRFTFDPKKNYFGVVMQQGRVQLDSDWNEWQAQLAHRLETGTLDILGTVGVSATTPAAFQVTPSLDPSQTPPVPHVSIGVGRMYVDGILAENSGAADVDYTLQPYYPEVTPIKGTGPFLFYLDVWQREVTYLQDPDLVEKAVGIDTTGRYQTVWQVKYTDVGKVSGFSCATQDAPDGPWTTAIMPSGSQLTTGVVGLPTTLAGSCPLNAISGYTGLENQLYRVEIHQPGSAGTATFKYARDAVATAVTAISGSAITVQNLGKDQVLGFQAGDWVEITDDSRELRGVPGILCQIKSIDFTATVITMNSSPDITVSQPDPFHTRMIRWDQAGVVYESDGTTVWADLNATGGAGIRVPPLGTTLILENGITVAFDLAATGGLFRTGDYWTFAARTADASVEVLTQAAPFGIRHHYCRLGVVDFRPSKPAATDCRPLFATLANRSVHVVDVRMDSAPLKNDGIYTFDNLSKGINVVCDMPVDPAIITQPQNPNNPVCVLSIDIPAVAEFGAGFNPFVVQSNVTVSPANNTINWIPAAGAVNPPSGPSTAQPLLSRLTLTGRAIRAAGNPNVLLNGATEVVPSTPNGLRLPSGDGRPHADFEIWFWLSAQPLVTLSTNKLDFGDQLVGLSVTQSVILTNNSPNQITISSIAVLQDSTAFAVVAAPSAPVLVEAKATYTISVTFTASTTGTVNATLNITESVDSTPLGIPLRGNGITRLMTVSAAPSPWLDVSGGTTSAPQTLTLTSVGTSPVTVSGIGLDDNSNFQQTNSVSGSNESPQVDISVLFTPQATGLIQTTLRITHDATNEDNPLLIPLKGTGTQLTVPEVTGKLLTEATDILVQAGLVVGNVTAPPHLKPPQSQVQDVYRSDPAAGQPYPADKKINLFMENRGS